MAPAIEVVIFILLVITSAVSSGSAWLEETGNVVIWGLALMVGSYIHLFLASYLMSLFFWIYRRLGRQVRASAE